MKRKILLFSLLLLCVVGFARPAPAPPSITTLTGSRPVRFPIEVQPAETSKSVTIPVEGVSQGDPCTCGFQADSGTGFSGAITVTCYAESAGSVQFVLTNDTQQAMQYGEGTALAVCWQFDPAEVE